jgi:hypothetical protein
MRAASCASFASMIFDWVRGLVSVRQSVLREESQSPKSENAIRCFALSLRAANNIKLEARMKNRARPEAAVLVACGVNRPARFECVLQLDGLPLG